MIIFHTKHLDQIRYKRLVMYILWYLYRNDLTKVSEFLSKVEVHLWSTDDTRLEFFEHITTTSGQTLNPNMPSGVAGKNRVDLFLYDTRFTGLGFRFRSNSDRIQHELAHEAYWLKSGTVNGNWVKVIHDYNKYDIRFKFDFYIRDTWFRIPISVIDIRKHL